MNYIDLFANMQVLGALYNNPSILEKNEQYFFTEEDFTEPFHKVLFESIFNLHALGADKITTMDIEKYLESRPKKYAIYLNNKGSDYLDKLSDTTQVAAFDYYYNRMKKMTLLRIYHNNAGLDVSWLYDCNNVLDVKKKQAQEDWLDNTKLEDIADLIEKKIEKIKLKYVYDIDDKTIHAANGMNELIEKYKNTPEVGYPLYGKLINGVTRGARLKKFYLRSAATGIGKTRSLIADTCFIGCSEIFDLENHKWKDNGTIEPVLFISTEQELEEIQTMMLAFISGVNESHILFGKYDDDELDRVIKAIEIFTKSKIYIEELPDFSIKDIENSIKRSIHEHEIKYVFFDYIHTSMKILEEISSKSGVKGLREDNILFLISVKLKEICNQYDIFLMSATQLNSDYTTAQQYDQNLLRGAKAIADKIDTGMIMLEVSTQDKEALSEIIQKNGLPMPEIKIAIYKNRRGSYKNILLWCSADRGCCRINPIFATNYNYQLVTIEDLDIQVQNE